jgi:hypothetical protein
MRYTDEGEHPASGKRSLKTSRHGTGSRVFPVPQALIDLGLPDYLRWLKDQGEAALFPKLTQTSKGLYDPWARWWRAYIRDAKAIADDKRQLREMRHNFPTAARESKLPSEAISYLLGHSIPGQTSNYGSLESHGVYMAEVQFKGLKLDKVRKWSAPQ